MLTNKVLAIDLAKRGIRVNIIALGYFRTAMTAHSYANPKLRAKRLERMIIQRYGKPNEYDLYKKNGGDGFYGGLSVAYMEPLMQKKDFCRGYLPECDCYRGAFNYHKGICPVAERVQPKMMQFKTNYRNLDVAKLKADALRKTIKKIEG